MSQAQPTPSSDAAPELPELQVTRDRRHGLFVLTHCGQREVTANHADEIQVYLEVSYPGVAVAWNV